MKSKNANFANLPTTIFTTMSALARETGAINLGQGFPDEDGPLDIRKQAAQYVVDGPNQYPPGDGMPELRQAVAANNQRFYGMEVDWQSQVLVTSGATEALTASILALVSAGDEVILIEPSYDSYLPIVLQAGGVPRFVRLHGPDWRLDHEELHAAFSSKTKAILINSPMNPTGRVFDQSDLTAIAGLVEEFNAYAICDEVYEHLWFDDARHIPLMTLPGMAERSLRIGSAGKTFSLTGWKVGYITGPAHLIEVVGKAHQFLTFTTPPNLQLAVAYGLGKDEEYFSGLAASMEGKRDRLSGGLAGAGFDVMPCQGTYFVTTDISKFSFDGSDADFCLHITREAGVAAIPLSVFYAAEAPTHYVRFAFCKADDMLDEAVDRLKRFF